MCKDTLGRPLCSPTPQGATRSAMAPLGALSPLHLGLDLRTPPVGRCVGPQFSKVVDDCVRRLGELSNAVSAPLARQVGSEHLGAELVGGQELRLRARVEVSVGAAGGRGTRKDRVGGRACVVGRGRGGGAAEDRSDGVEGGGEEAGGGAGCLGRGRVVRGCVGGPLGATGAEAEGGAWVAAKW